MKRALKILASSSLWLCFGIALGMYHGNKIGYAAAARDVMRPVLELREVPDPPPGFTKGDI